MDNLKPVNRLNSQYLNTEPPKVGRGTRSAPQREKTLVNRIVSGEPYLTKPPAPQHRQAPQPPIEDIIKQVPPAMLQAIKDWEALEERESRGWGPGGEPVKPPKVKASDILKAEAIMKAMQRMNAAANRPTGEVSKSS